MPSETDWGVSAGKPHSLVGLAACAARLSRTAFLMWRNRGGKRTRAGVVHTKFGVVVGGAGVEVRRVWLARGKASIKCILNVNCPDRSSSPRSNKSLPTDDNPIEHMQRLYPCAAREKFLVCYSLYKTFVEISSGSRGGSSRMQKINSCQQYLFPV